MAAGSAVMAVFASRMIFPIVLMLAASAPFAILSLLTLQLAF